MSFSSRSNCPQPSQTCCDNNIYHEVVSAMQISNVESLAVNSSWSVPKICDRRWLARRSSNFSKLSLSLPLILKEVNTAGCFYARWRIETSKFCFSNLMCITWVLRLSTFLYWSVHYISNSEVFVMSMLFNYNGTMMRWWSFLKCECDESKHQIGKEILTQSSLQANLRMCVIVSGFWCTLRKNFVQ